MASPAFATEQRRRKQVDDDAYELAQTREWAADDTRRASLSSMKSLNRGAYPLISSSLALAPASGYTGKDDYLQGLDDQQTIAKHNGGSVRYGGTVAQRPSLSALRGGDDPNDFAARNARNLDPVAPTAEQQRQGRLLNDMDTRTEVGIRGDQAANRRNFDLNSGAVANEAQVLGDIHRTQGLEDARAGSDIYFDPRVKAKREDEFYNQMEQIRRRYSDPAIVRGQAEAEAARVRGMYGMGREQISGDTARAVQGLRNTGAARNADVNANARVAASAAGAGAPVDDYTPRSFDPNDGDSGAGKTMTRDEFNAWQAQSGLNPRDAEAVARQSGYVIR